jgi:predicted Zn-dependent protease
MGVGQRDRLASEAGFTLKGHRERSYFDFEDSLALGEWLHTELVDNFGLETEAWAVATTRRVERQLQVYRAPRDRMVAEILWLAEPNAFTAPGRYLYITRELLQRAASDDPVAFVVAHEMAHHDLGHLDAFRGHASILRRIPAGARIALLVRAAEWLLIGPEAEADADRYAFQLCRKAGYDPLKCLELFDILESYALDHGALDTVFGSEESMADEVQAVRHWASRLKEWGFRRIHRYPSIRERKDSLLRLLE